MFGAVWAQSAADTTRIECRLLRQQENWRSLKDDDRGWAALKAVPVGGGASTVLTVEGEARTYVHNWRHEQWGRLSAHDTYTLQRLMLHGDVSSRLIGKQLGLRAFVQLKSGFVAGRDGPVFSTSKDRLGINQSFLEEQRSSGPERAVTLRAGRVDAFLAQASTTRPGVFDNDRKTGRTLWGMHMTRQGADGQISPYYFGTTRDIAPTDPTLRSTRHTFGMRGSSGQCRR